MTLWLVGIVYIPPKYQSYHRLKLRIVFHLVKIKI